MIENIFLHFSIANIAIMEWAPTIGEKFDSFEQLETRMDKYQETIRKGFRKQNTKSSADANLKYHSLYYRCKCSGKPESKGTRISKKTDCPFFVHLIQKRENNRMYLKVKDMNLQHNDLCNHNQEKYRKYLYL